MRVREHRALLVESLETAVEIAENRPALVAHVIKTCAPLLEVKARDIKVKPYGPHPSLGDPQWIVLIEGYGVFGFIDHVVEPGPWLTEGFYPDLLERYREILCATEDWVGPDKAGRTHLLWMLDELESRHEQSLTKKHRWLGFIQGVMVDRQLIDVDEERDHTRPIFMGA